MNIERRIAALESKIDALDASLKLVIAEHGETKDDAMTRAGYRVDAGDVMCVVFVSPSES